MTISCINLTLDYFLSNYHAIASLLLEKSDTSSSSEEDCLCFININLYFLFIKITTDRVKCTLQLIDNICTKYVSIICKAYSQLLTLDKSAQNSVYKTGTITDP